MINNQRFEILTAYELFENFINNKSNYKQDVFRSIENEFNSDAEYPFLFEFIKNDMKPNEDLKKELELLKKTNFIHIIDSAFQIITKELPAGPDTKILFIPANPEYRDIFKRYDIGIHAITPGTGRIIISIDPTIKN
jgi:hypothetical protein